MEEMPTTSHPRPLKHDGDANISDFVPEASNIISGQADEDIDADNEDFYESSVSHVSESSYEEDTTDYSSTWTAKPKPAENPKAEFLAQFSEDNHVSKAAKKSSTVSPPSISEEPSKSAIVTKWLEEAAKTDEQNCDPSESHVGTSSDTEVDKPSEDEAPAIDQQAGSNLSLAKTECELAATLEVVDQYESSDEGSEQAEESPSLNGRVISSLSEARGVGEEESTVSRLETTESRPVSEEAGTSIAAQPLSSEVPVTRDDTNTLAGGASIALYTRFPFPSPNPRSQTIPLANMSRNSPASTYPHPQKPPHLLTKNQPSSNRYPSQRSGADRVRSAQLRRIFLRVFRHRVGP